MILSRAQCDRFLASIDELFLFANDRLDLHVRLFDEANRSIPEAQMEIGIELWRRPDVIDAFVAENPASLPPRALERIAAWKDALPGPFAFMKRPDGSLELLYENHIIELTGLSREVGSLVRGDCGMLETALLPFEGAVVFPCYISEYPIEMGSGLREQYEKWFAEARDGGAVIRTSDQFLQIVPQLREQAVAREAQQLIEDTEYDLNPPTEFPGVHRGRLADLSPEERDAASSAEAHRVFLEADGGQLPSIRDRLRSWCAKGPASTKFAALASMEKNAVLEHNLRTMGARRSSGLNKKQLVAALDERIADDPESVCRLLRSLDPREYDSLKGLFDQGGRREVVLDEVKSLADFPKPLPLLCYLFEQDGRVSAIIPDEVFRAMGACDLSGVDDYHRDTTRALTVADLLVSTRGMVTFDEAFEEYARLFPESADSGLFAESLLYYALHEEGAFVLLCDKDVTQNYLLHWELLDELERCGGEVLDTGTGVYIGELGILENLLAAREGVEPWRLPDNMVRSRDFFVWARKLPSARTFEQFLNEHVPDDQNDYFFAERVMEEIVMHGTGGVDPGMFVQFLSDQGLAFGDIRQENKMLGLLLTLLNDLPRWDNNGWPATALHEAVTATPQFRNPDGSLMKIGRNDPCPCGSGKKYKKCCGR